MRNGNQYMQLLALCTYVAVSLTFRKPWEMSLWSSPQAVIPSFRFSSEDFLSLAFKTWRMVWISYST